MPVKLVVAMMMHETNTFSPLPTPIEILRPAGRARGPTSLSPKRRAPIRRLGGFIDVVRAAGAEFVVPDGRQRASIPAG